MLPLFFERLLESGVHIHDAMVSRGFIGTLPGWRRLAFSGRDAAFLALTALAVALISPAMMKDTVIEIRDLNFTYDSGKPTLSGIDLTVGRGECVGLVGPNGAGKSTLLLHLNGVLRGRGEVRVLGLAMTPGQPEGDPPPRRSGLPGPAAAAVPAQYRRRHRLRPAQRRLARR